MIDANMFAFTHARRRNDAHILPKMRHARGLWGLLRSGNIIAAVVSSMCVDVIAARQLHGPVLWNPTQRCQLAAHLKQMVPDSD